MESAPKRLAITKHVDLEAPLDRVWAAITEPQQLARWFPESIESGSLATGSRGWLVWQQYGRFAFEIETLEPPHRLVWRWTHDAGLEIDEAPTTRVEFNLEARPNGGTRLTVHETGFRTEKHHRENEGGWLHELSELASYLHP